MAGSCGLGRAEGAWLDLSRLFAAGSMALGSLVLVGWALGVDSLTRVAPGLITMKPNAALCFVLAGACLWSIREVGGSGLRAIGVSAAVAAVGGLTLLEYLSGVNLGIDEILFVESRGQVGSLFAGRMHPTTAFNFLILGLAMVLMVTDREPRAAQGLALLAALIAGSTLIGYLYGVRLFVGLALYHQMALHTTLGMLALAAGLLLARPGQGLMVSITANGPSGQMARWLMPVAILMPIVITGLVMRAREAGLFDERYGSAVRVTVVIAIFVGCIWRSSHSLYRVDQERRLGDSKRVEGERKARFLAESMPQIVWTARPDGIVDYFNLRWFEFTGMTVEQVRRQGWRLVLHPEDLGRREGCWDRSVRTGEKFEIESRIRRADGAFRWHLGRAEPMRDDGGRIVQWVGTCTDIHDQKTTGEKRYRLLVEGTTAIVWNTPPSGIFESEQPGWAAFTGQTFDQLKGWGWLDAIHADDRSNTARRWSESVEHRVPYQVEHRIRRHDGEYRAMLVKAVPLTNGAGEIVEWVGVHTDIDDQKRAQDSMRQAKEAAEAATRAKSEFLANMSHEIRTPMNGVMGMTELAMATDLTPSQREYLGLVKSSADALLTVIDDILDFSKIEAGKLHLEPIPFSPREVLTDLLRCLAWKAHDKGLELACRVDPRVPESLVGDPGRLRQVLVNLVGNALKFTEHGEVVVSIEPDPEEESGSAFRFSIADTGIGIPVEKRASIFVPFEQADNSTTRKFGGTGLGLTISARLIGLMGGRIWVEEHPGGGSIFRFTARLEVDLEGRATAPPAVPDILGGLRVLIVDDNRTNRLILDEVLGQWGCRPISVAGAVEALAALDEADAKGEPFAMVLLDLMMPGMDGCELARRVRADPRHAPVKMLMLTSGGPDEPGRSDDLGIGAWLAKPIRQSELLGALLDQLAPLEGAAKPVPIARPTPLPTARRRRQLRVLLAEDHPINQKVASRMLEAHGHEVTVVGNGRLAVEAVASGTFDVVLMDVQMPEMDGFEALATIRARVPAGGIRPPIVALTAHAMAGDRESCLAAGFDDYLPKPIQAAALVAALARVVGDDREPAPPVDDRPAFDLSSAMENLGGDERLLAEILRMFLDDGPRFLSEIRSAIDAGDQATLGRLGHSLAGASGHFAAEELADLARKLEATGKAGDLAGASTAFERFGPEFARFRQAVADSGIDLKTQADREASGIGPI